MNANNINSNNFNENQLAYLDAMQKVSLNQVEMIKRGHRGAKLTEYLAGLPNKGQLNSLQREILIGAMLGAGTLRKGDGAVNVSFKLDLAIQSKEVVEFVYLIFQDLVGSPPRIQRRADGRASLWFRTYRLPELRHWQNIFYTVNAKGDLVRVIPDLLHRWITPLSLAIWFMDDGSKDATGGYYLHTQCFTLGEAKKLQQILGNLFHLEVTVHKDKKYHRLYILKSNISKFNALVEPFIFPCMRYKLHTSITRDT